MTTENKNKNVIYSQNSIDVSTESFEDKNGKIVNFVKIRVLKDRGNEVKVQYITLSPDSFKSLVNDLHSLINK